MANLRVQRRRRNRSDGASLVEFALILPVFVVLIFGMITGGIALSQQNSLRNAVRESTRFAAVNDRGADPTDLTYASDVVPYLDAVIAQTERAASGDLGDEVEGKRVCAAHSFNGSSFVSRTKIGSSTTSGATACFADSLSEPRTQVVAGRKTEIGAIFFTIPINLESSSVSRYERD